MQNTKKEAAAETKPTAQAQSLIVSGNFPAAAQEYLRLSTLYPEQAVVYQLRATDSFIRANDINQASSILADIKTIKHEDSFHKNIFMAIIELKKNEVQAALNLLSSSPRPETSLELLSLWRLTRAQAYEQSTNFLNAVEVRIQLDKNLLDPVERLANIKQIWADLNRIKLPTLRELRRSGSESLTAWIELSIINQTLLFKPEYLEQAMQSWINQYPGHAATPTITREILTLSNKAVLQPKHIALLLPLTGQYENAAHAIRDGFLGAWYEEQGTKPLISIYDANALNIESVYREAVSKGADFLVGPLEKQAVDTLLESGRLNVMTLALNSAEHANLETIHRDSQYLPSLIQFGLSPEGEARQAAQRAIFDGHSRALVITPDNEWGLRLAEAFGETFTALGGEVIEYVSYDPRSRDYSTPVKELLNIDSSQFRVNVLRQKLNRNLINEPRLREDADMVFMTALPLAARQIVPQFSFYLASGMPVYSSSHVYTGIVNSQADSDMNGILFTDMPALLKEENQSSSIHRQLNRSWSMETSTNRRLYALGIDAYRLIPFLGKLVLKYSSVYHGEIGDLYLSTDGRIERKLLWARFVNGEPRLLDDDPEH